MTDRGVEGARPRARRRTTSRSRRPDVATLASIRAAVNQPWPSDQVWRSTSSASAASKSGCHGTCAQRLLRRADSGFGTLARRRPRARGAAVERARRREGSATRGRSRPARAPSIGSPNSTIAAAACGPTTRSSIHVWPPPGCRPMRRKRASKRAEAPAIADVAREREVHPGADGGAVDRGDRRQRRTQHAEESFVDRHDRAALAIVGVRRRERAEARDVGAAAERGRLAGDHDRADRRRSLRAGRRSRRSRATIGARHRVATLPVDERDDRDAVGLVDPNVFHQLRAPSGRTTADECRKKVSTSRWYSYVGFVSPTAPASRSPCANASTVPALVYSVREAGALEAAVVDRAAVAQQHQRLGREVPAAEDAASAPRPSAVSTGGSASAAPAEDRAHLAPRQVAVAGDVVDAGDVVRGRVHQRADDVVLVHELHARIEAEDLGDDPASQRVRERGVDVVAEHVREAQQRDGDVRVVVGEVAEERLDLEQRPFDRGARARACASCPRGTRSGPGSSRRTRAPSS